MDERELTIEKLVYGGDGLSREEGRVVLTPFVLPGERVRAQVTKERGDLSRGILVEVLEASPYRESPQCPYFTRCGGCHYQHIGYEQQLEQKRAILRETLRRTGKIVFEGEIAAVFADPWHYRNRIQLHIDNGKLGYFAAGSHQICAVDACPVASPSLNRAIDKIHAALAGLGSFQATVELFTNETDLQIHVREKTPRAAREFFDTLGVTSAIGYAGLRVGRRSFFQVNRFLIEPLVAASLGGASGEVALDLYSGVGLFARALARSFVSVTAIEAGGSSFRDLEHNAHRVENPWRAIQSAVEDFLPSVSKAPEFILADPPRAGLGRSVTAELLRIRAPRLAIVSCDPSTLARDLAPLVNGGYRIRKLTLADLFPQTFHIETVVHLEAG